MKSFFVRHKKKFFNSYLTVLNIALIASFFYIFTISKQLKIIKKDMGYYDYQLDNIDSQVSDANDKVKSMDSRFE